MKSDLMETRQFHITPIIVIVTLISMIPIIFYSENTVEQICIISDFILLLYVALKTRIIYNRKCLLFIIFCSLSLLLTVAFYQGQGVKYLHRQNAGTAARRAESQRQRKSRASAAFCRE